MALNFKKNKDTVFSDLDVRNKLHRNLDFVASEQYRLLRANLRFTIPADVKCPIIGVTSSTRGEGKSTTSINLSYVLAEKGYKVLLIDGDLRIPSIAKKLGIHNDLGLTDIILGANADMASWKSNIHKNWYILPSGQVPPNPSELLGSKRMENVLNVLTEHFDYIILDLPPVNIVSDAMAVSGLLTGLIMVIRDGYTSKRELDRCMRQVNLSEANILGFVMNESADKSASYTKNSKYKYYRSQDAENEEE